MYLYMTAWLYLGVFLWLKWRHRSRDPDRCCLMKCFTAPVNWCKCCSKVWKAAFYPLYLLFLSLLNANITNLLLFDLFQFDCNFFWKHNQEQVFQLSCPAKSLAKLKIFQWMCQIAKSLAKRAEHQGVGVGDVHFS